MDGRKYLFILFTFLFVEWCDNYHKHIWSVLNKKWAPQNILTTNIARMRQLKLNKVKVPICAHFLST